MIKGNGSPTSLSLSFFICKMVQQKHPHHFPHGCIVKIKCDKGCRGTLHLFKTLRLRNFLVVQWIGICLTMQGTRVLSLVREDSHALGPQLLSHELQLLKPRGLEPVSRNRRHLRNEKPHTPRQRRPCSPQLQTAQASNEGPAQP